MSLAFILPIFLGMTVVTQGILNRKIGAEWGLSSVVLLNAAIFFIISICLILWAKFNPESLPEIFRLQGIDLGKVKPWFVIPGICGFILVMGVPWSLHNLGPSKTFIFLIVSQVVFSLLVEKFFYEASIGVLKIIGAVLAVLGAGLVVLS